MGPVSEPGHGPVPSVGGLTRVLARASAPPVALQDPGVMTTRGPAEPVPGPTPYGEGGWMADPPLFTPLAVPPHPAPSRYSAAPGGANVTPPHILNQSTPSLAHPTTRRAVEPSGGPERRVAPVGEWMDDRLGELASIARATSLLKTPDAGPMGPSPALPAGRRLRSSTSTEAGTIPEADSDPLRPVPAVEVASVVEPSASPMVRDAVPVPSPNRADLAAISVPDHPRPPERVPPVVIGRIDVHVDSPAAQADPFAGCRIVAAGLTARRGGGW
jgi:hypothetical protein